MDKVDRSLTSATNQAEQQLLPRQVPDGGIQAWLRVGAYSVCCFGTIGVQYVFGLLYDVLLDDMPDAPQEQIALIGSLSMFTMLCSSPIAGLLCERFGLRRTCAAGGVLAALGCLLSAFATAPWHLHLTFGLVVGFGHSLAAMAPLILTSLWFDRRMGLALGVANSGSAMSPLLLGPIAPTLLARVGWRHALLGLACVEIALLLSAASCLTPPPSSAVAARSGSASGSSPTPPTPARAMPRHSTPLSRLVRRKEILCIGLTLFTYGIACWVPVVHLVRLGVDWGLSRAEASRLLSFLALGNCTLRVPAGLLADRFGRTRTFCALVAFYAILDLAVAAVGDAAPRATSLSPPLNAVTNGSLTSTPTSATMLPVFSFCAGGLTGGCNVLAATLTADLLPHADAQRGTTLVFPLFGLGLMLGPVAAGVIHRSAESYAKAIGAAGVALALASAMAGGLVLVAAVRWRASRLRAGSRTSPEVSFASRQHDQF
jgi:MFS family permease